MLSSRSVRIVAAVVGVLLVSATGVLAGCGSGDTSAAGASSGSGTAGATTHVYGTGDTAVTVAVDDQFIIQLDSNPTTGYQWKVTLDGDAEVTLAHSEFRLGLKATDGAWGHARWTYTAVRAGTGKLVFGLSLPSRAPDKTETFALDITR